MIKNNMCFNDFCDFYSRRKFIREMYKNLSSDDKVIYKYYVYSRRVMKEKVCDMIWEFINAFDEEEYIIKEEKLYQEREKYL